jgi:hypothetical protein
MLARLKTRSAPAASIARVTAMVTHVLRSKWHRDFMIPTSFFAGLRNAPKSAAQVILSVDVALLTLARVFRMVHLLLTATLAREVNGKMMGKLLFGNVGSRRRASQEAWLFSFTYFFTRLSLLLSLPGIP